MCPYVPSTLSKRPSSGGIQIVWLKSSGSNVESIRCTRRSRSPAGSITRTGSPAHVAGGISAPILWPLLGFQHPARRAPEHVLLRSVVVEHCVGPSPKDLVGRHPPIGDAPWIIDRAEQVIDLEHNPERRPVWPELEGWILRPARGGECDQRILG